MKLSRSALNKLAEMICGSHGSMGGFSWPAFPYRSSWYLSEFFSNCGLPYQHDGSTRVTWVYSVLEELNEGEASNASLPSDGLLAVIKTLTDPVEFSEENYSTAIDQINRVLSGDGLHLKIVQGQSVIENLNTHISTESRITGRLMNREEKIREDVFSSFLENASEDEFTEYLLLPLFVKLGYERVSLSGHQDKHLEFGKDIWMRYRLPTAQVLYFGVQVKVGRIHSSGSSLSTNIGGILAQLLMLLSNPIFDPETNSKHLPDHVFLVSSGSITKQARTLLSEVLNNAMRRNILFMDREDILDLCIRYSIPLPGEPLGANHISDERVDTEDIQHNDDELQF